MTPEKAIVSEPFSFALPAVRRITPADLKDALVRGFGDFMANPSHIVLLVLIYPVAGLIIGRLTFGHDVLPLLFPLIAGFALIGPVASIGLFELSRRREQGLEIEWKYVLDVFRSHSLRAIVTLALLLMAVFVVWLLVAQGIYTMTFGDRVPASFGGFLHEVFTTAHGWALIVIGNAVGFIFALFVLAIGAVSFPLLLDRDVDAWTAATTSIRACLANPMTMALWGLIVAAALVIGMIPLFVGLAIVLPVLGHATWHLYRKVVER